MADNPKTTLLMVLAAIALILFVGVALLRRARAKNRPKTAGFDPYERASRMREERERRTHRR